MKVLITGGSGFIGSELIKSMIMKNIDLLNIDTKIPKTSDEIRCWQNCDILDYSKVKQIFSEYNPTHIIHLAAKTDVDAKHINDYKANTLGTAIILSIASDTSDVIRVILTSSQHVHKPGYGMPKHDLDFRPYKQYGKSKIISELIIREYNDSFCWVIIRPTTIWGPNHFGLTNGLWRLISKGVYFHPMNDSVVRSFGYIKNVIHQIESILLAPSEIVDKKVIYVGDPCILQKDWVNKFSIALTGKNTKYLPKIVLFLIASVGEILKYFKIKFPLKLERFRNLTTSNPVPIAETIKLFGDSPINLDTGIKETVDVLKNKSGQS